MMKPEFALRLDRRGAAAGATENDALAPGRSKPTWRSQPEFTQHRLVK
jgi:hypothetical protein